MGDDLLKIFAEKHGLKFETIKEIIECERKYVHKERRHIMGDLKEIVEKAAKEEVILIDY